MRDRWPEFFEGENNRFSMARGLQFLAFFPSTIVLLYLRTAEALGLYLGAFVLNSLGNKIADKIGAKNAVAVDESEDVGDDSGDAGDSVDSTYDKRKLGRIRKARSAR
jgi:hypothetical protein